MVEHGAHSSMTQDSAGPDRPANQPALDAVVDA